MVQEIYRHAPNNLYADVILPAATWGEWVSGTYIQSERRVYITDGTANPIPRHHARHRHGDRQGQGHRPNKLGLDGDAIFPYQRKENGFYDPEEIFRDIVKASKGSDADLSGMLEVEERDGIGLYEQIRQHRGIQWPAPNYEIAKQGGTKRRYMNQEHWEGKPYGEFRTPDGKLHIHLCEQDYSNREEINAELMRAGTEEGYYLIDHYDVLVQAPRQGADPRASRRRFPRQEVV